MENLERGLFSFLSINPVVFTTKVTWFDVTLGEQGTDVQAQPLLSRMYVQIHNCTGSLQAKSGCYDSIGAQVFGQRTFHF